MRTAPWRGHLRPKSPLRRVPLAVWHLGQLARAIRICLSVPVRHSFLKRAVANRSAHSRYSVLYVLIYKGDGLYSIIDRKICIAHRSSALRGVLMRKSPHQNHTSVGRGM